MKAIEIKGLKKRYKDVTAVDSLTLDINEGELFALLGVNGAGKTTAVKMLSGLTRPTSGDASIFGKSVVKDTAAVKEIVDISMQETAIARNLTVLENLRFYADLCGAADAENRIREITELFNLSPVLNKKTKNLSGGYQRKVSIALSLISDPKVLFLDEPTLGLDVIARRELWKAINRLKSGRAVILTTHYMEEAEALSDRIGIMKQGKLLFCGTKEELAEKTGKQGVEEGFISIVSDGETND